MIISDLDKLAVLIKRDCDVLLSRWRQQVKELPSAQHLDTPTLNDHLPELIDELATALQTKSDETIPEALNTASPPVHGLQRVKDGFDIEEVVAEYNILRGCIHDLAQENGLTLQGKPFHILNRVLDGAIGLAVKTFATAGALEVQHRREDYLAFVAHDLRTPLNAISLATSVLERTLPAPSTGAAQAQIFKTLHRNVQHLNGLVGKVIEENTKLMPELGVKLERRAFDLWPLVESLVQDLDPLARTAHTRLINQVPDDLVVFADAGLLRRVFQNVIANAIEYTPRGEVLIGAKELGAEDGIECWVSDTGAGIPQERLEKVFDKAETDPGKEGGSGLGLAIAKTFIEAHDGKLKVESKEGVGSTFRFTLPPRQSESTAASKASLAARTARRE
jgi:two-component system, OmpR family, phosphate regulon sensor histidine kinase PhoR